MPLEELNLHLTILSFIFIMFPIITNDRIAPQRSKIAPARARKSIERVGHLQGFTYMPKFTHRESLTPEPPNLIGAMEPHISQ